ncbi:MAG: HAMP domain-containing histidine kinase [Myxococcales bacterium]|nr:HAMP domain-containing histidine kinase [Myxococcales bacterium]
MSWLDDLRAHLEEVRLQAEVGVRPVDVGVFRRHLVHRLEQNASDPKVIDFLAYRHAEWLDAFPEWLVGVRTRLMQSFGADEDRLDRLTRAVIAAEIGLPAAEEISPVEAVETAELARHAAPLLGAGQDAIGRYCREVRLVVGDRPAARDLSELGRVALGLQTYDLVRWLLTCEVLQCLGSDDEWRLHASCAEYLANHPKGTMIDDPDDPWAEDWPWSRSVTQRLASMGVFAWVRHDHGDLFERYAVHERFIPLLQQLGAGRLGTYGSLAASLIARLEDSPPLADAAQTTRGESALARALGQRAQEAAHEIRNIVFPIRQSVGRLPRTTEAEDDLRRIQQGLERLEGFARDQVRVAELIGGGDETFDVRRWVDDAVDAVEAELGHRAAVHHDLAEGLTFIRGVRANGVRALTNVLRNDWQVRPVEAVQVEISLSPMPDGRLRLAVDDDGPGVPLGMREAIFDQGVYWRPGGTGMGLAVARREIEVMQGTIRCADSPLGGARFLIELPVADRGRR